MSNLNITRNTFLEKEELTRLQKFMINNVTHDLFVANSRSYGVVQSDFINTIPTDWLIQAGTNSGSIKISTDSRTFDSDGLMSFQPAFDNYVVPADIWYWVRVSHQYTPTEIGTVSVDASGNLTGIGTKFSEVLRGMSTDVPVKIKFIKTDSSAPVNDQVYTIVSSVSDTAAIIIGATSVFTAETNLKYIVIGTTPVSEILSAEQLLGIYNYDSCLVELVAEETADTPPSIGYIAGKNFYVARIKNISGLVSVTDKRTGNWWDFNIRGLFDKLDKSNNLSDILDAVAARANLDVYSKEEIDAKFNSSNKILFAGSFSVGNVAAGAGSGFNITFPSVGTAEYYVIGTMISNNWVHPEDDSNIMFTVGVLKTSTSFYLHVKEQGASTQNLTFEYLLIKK